MHKNDKYVGHMVSNKELIVIEQHEFYITRQLCPRYEGQLTWMAEPICHSFRFLVRPHDYHHSGLRTDGEGRTERVIERGRCLRTILRAVCGDGSGARRGRAPYDHLIRPPT